MRKSFVLALSLLLLTTAACEAQLDRVPDTPDAYAPSPTITLEPNPVATRDAANTQAARAEATITANAGQTATSAALAQAEHNRRETQVWGEVTRDSITQSARETGTAQVEVDAGKTATATFAIGYDQLKREQAELALEFNRLDIQERAQEIQRWDDTQFVRTWGPTILVVLTMIIGGLVFFAAYSRGLSWFENIIMTFAAKRYGHVVVDAYDPNTPPWKRWIQRLFGVTGKTVVNTPRMPGPVVELEPTPREDGFRVHSPMLAPDAMQERTTARAQASEYARAAHEHLRNPAVIPASAIAAGMENRHPVQPIQALQQGMRPALEPPAPPGDVVDAPEVVEILPSDALRHRQIGAWIDEVEASIEADN